MKQGKIKLDEQKIKYLDKYKELIKAFIKLEARAFGKNEDSNYLDEYYSLIVNKILSMGATNYVTLKALTNVGLVSNLLKLDFYIKDGEDYTIIFCTCGELNHTGFISKDKKAEV